MLRANLLHPCRVNSDEAGRVNGQFSFSVVS